MTVAFLGDIHGNAPALKQVLADAQTRGAQQFCNVGDIVGEAPFPNETIQLLINHQVVSIRGNFDRNVYDFEERIKKIADKKHHARVAAVRFSHSAIKPEFRDYLRQLPQQREVEIDGLKVLLVHGSPRKDNDRIYGSTPESELANYASMTDAQVIVCGHTHMPFVRCAADKWFINTGSVGRPANDSRACYVLATLAAPRTVQAEVIRVDYPVQEVIEAIERHGLPAELKEVFTRGKKLNDPSKQ